MSVVERLLLRPSSLDGHFSNPEGFVSRAPAHHYFTIMGLIGPYVNISQIIFYLYTMKFNVYSKRISNFAHRIGSFSHQCDSEAMRADSPDMLLGHSLVSDKLVDSVQWKDLGETELPELRRVGDHDDPFGAVAHGADDLGAFEKLVGDAFLHREARSADECVANVKVREPLDRELPHNAVDRRPELAAYNCQPNTGVDSCVGKKQHGIRHDMDVAAAE